MLPSLYPKKSTRKQALLSLSNAIDSSAIPPHLACYLSEIHWHKQRFFCCKRTYLTCQILLIGSFHWHCLYHPPPAFQLPVAVSFAKFREKKNGWLYPWTYMAMNMCWCSLEFMQYGSLMQLEFAKQSKAHLSLVTRIPGISTAIGYWFTSTNISVPGILPRVSVPGWMELSITVTNDTPTWITNLDN